MLSGFFFRLAISLAAMLIALLAAVTALGYFAYALDLLLVSYLPPSAAAALTGAIVLLIAIVLIAVARGATRSRRKRERPPSMEAVENAAELGNDLGRKLRGLAGAHASGGLMAALIAGFAVGASPKLRSFLKSILKS